MYTFCKSANMALPNASAAYVERVPEAWSHGATDAEHDSIDTARGDVERHQEGVTKDAHDRAHECDEDRDRTDRRPDQDATLNRQDELLRGRGRNEPMAFRGVSPMKVERAP